MGVQLAWSLKRNIQPAWLTKARIRITTRDRNASRRAR